MPSRLLDAGELLWLSDHTPHEAVPNETGEAYYRQFFYLTTGVGVWYSQHNTANPLGIKPDAEISDANKFDLLGVPHPPPARIQAHVARSGKALLRASLGAPEEAPTQATSFNDRLRFFESLSK